MSLYFSQSVAVIEADKLSGTKLSDIVAAKQDTSHVAYTIG